MNQANSVPEENKGRHRWMDSLRGLAILLVVHTHVVDSVFAKFPDAPEVLKEVTGPMSPLRMPVLVLLSGLLVSSSLNKGAFSYFTGKLSNIAYPFFVWTILMYVLYFLRERYLGEVSPIYLLEAVTISPFHHLRFLYYLIFFYIIAFFLCRASRTTALAVCVFIYIASQGTGCERFTSLLIFFMAGAFMGPQTRRVQDYLINDKKITAFSAAAVVAIFYLYALGVSFKSYGFFYSLAAMAICPLLVNLAIRLENYSASRPLEFLGRNSLVIYLVHVPVALTLPVLMQNIYTGNPTFVYPILMISTIFFSIVAAIMSNRAKLFSLLFSARGWSQ